MHHRAPLDGAYCDYRRRPDGRWQCPRCHDVARDRPRPPINPCTIKPIGDRLAAWLEARGLTRARYLAARGRWRIVGGMNCVLVELPDAEPGCCACDDRQAWLNWADNQARHLVNRLWPSPP